jgi:hypothetical protein
MGSKMTSLLEEALCGVDLPWGEGIETWVPLVLQLRQAQEDEYAVIQVVKENVLGGSTYQTKRNKSLLGRLEMRC